MHQRIQRMPCNVEFQKWFMYFGQTEAEGVIYTLRGLGPLRSKQEKRFQLQRASQALRSGPHLSCWCYAQVHRAPSQAPSRVVLWGGPGPSSVLNQAFVFLAWAVPPLLAPFPPALGGYAPSHNSTAEPAGRRLCSRLPLPSHPHSAPLICGIRRVPLPSSTPPCRSCPPDQWAARVSSARSKFRWSISDSPPFCLALPDHITCVLQETEDDRESTEVTELGGNRRTPAHSPNVSAKGRKRIVHISGIFAWSVAMNAAVQMKKKKGITFCFRVSKIHEGYRCWWMTCTSWWKRDGCLKFERSPSKPLTLPCCFCSCRFSPEFPSLTPGNFPHHREVPLAAGGSWGSARGGRPATRPRILSAKKKSQSFICDSEK